MSGNSNRTSRWRLPPQWRPDRHVFAFHEDSNSNAVLITRDGEVYAVAEERITRKRFQAGFPKESLAWIERTSGVRLDQASTLVFGNRTHFLPRILGSRFPSFQHDLFGMAHKLMLSFHHLCYISPVFSGLMELFNRSLLWLRFRKRIVIVDHHHAHAASAYYTSGHKAACAVSVDNYGDGYSAKVFDCEGSDIHFLHGASAIRSPGQFYGEIAQIAGIHPLLAGKLTGMSASGDPNVALQEMQRLFDVTADRRNFTRTFGWRWSEKSEPFLRLRSIHKPDLAASAQRQFEDALVKYVQAAVVETGRRHVVLAGGCFANVRVNQKVLELPEVDSVWIHPAMSDQGIAMGAALAYIASMGDPLPFHFEDILLGPEPTEEEMRSALEDHGLPYERPENMEERVARLLVEGNVIARFVGPLEYGLRALGNRSVLYQTQDPDLQPRLNRKLHRASYMPFAPVTMEPYAAQCYLGVENALEAARFMTISFYATDWMKENCPGVVHLDGTVRPQILRATDNPGMYRILDQYRRLTGIPSLLNTSFNLHEEPIVAAAPDACRAFKTAGLDYLICGPFLARQAQ